MKLSRLEQASDYQVAEWMEKKLQLTPYQKSKLTEDGCELLRQSPFCFYETAQKEKVSFLWRLTVIIFPVYWIAAFSFLPVMFLFTGKWGYGRKFIDNFHSKWIRKMGV